MPVVMLHGFGGSAEHWVGMATSLTRRFRVLAPDLPGFGGTSASPSERFFVPLQAERVHSFLQALRVERYHLVANSMGGNIAGALAERAPAMWRASRSSNRRASNRAFRACSTWRLAGERRRWSRPPTPSSNRLIDLAFVKRPSSPRGLLALTASEPRERGPSPRSVAQSHERGLPTSPRAAPCGHPRSDARRVGRYQLVPSRDRDRKLERGLPDMHAVRMKGCGTCRCSSGPPKCGGTSRSSSRGVRRARSQAQRGTGATLFRG